MAKKRILSISGGGIRGIIPICYLFELERQTGQSVASHFDFIAGTSTGACLTALIQSHVSMDQALMFYTGKPARRVFEPSGFLGTSKRFIKGYQYDPENLANELHAALGKQSAMKINDCPTKVLITSVAADGHTWFFVRDGVRNSGLTGRVGLVDAAVASSCAPTYHAPWPITMPIPKLTSSMQLSQPETLWMFDGGASCYGNPTHQACIEAFEYDDFTPEDTHVISLGTGYFRASSDPPDGLLPTIGWAVSTLVDSSEDLADRNARREYFRRSPASYTKLNPPLPRDVAEDDLSAIQDLVAVGLQAAGPVNWKKILA